MGKHWRLLPHQRNYEDAYHEKADEELDEDAQ
jgi:hypothetical protein